MNEKRVIYRYRNRKCYDKTNRKYVNSCDLLKSPNDSYVVIDYATKLDITEVVRFDALYRVITKGNKQALANKALINALIGGA